jgi:hypothetical protein
VIDSPLRSVGACDTVSWFEDCDYGDRYLFAWEANYQISQSLAKVIALALFGDEDA